MRLELIAEAFADLEPKCDDKSSGSQAAMTCELPPDHMCGPIKFNFHYGRDRLGRWRSWSMKSEENASSNDACVGPIGGSMSAGQQAEPEAVA